MHMFMSCFFATLKQCIACCSVGLYDTDKGVDSSQGAYAGERRRNRWTEGRAQ